jgi:methionyl-tRNA formyltransferase
MMRVLILTSSSRGTASRSIPVLAASEGIQIVSVILASGTPASPSRLRRRKIQKIRRIGLLGALNGIRIRPWFSGDATDSVETICKTLELPFHLSTVLNSDRTVDLFRAADADLGISLGNGYIPRRIFSIPRLGMINVHGERLPEYQNAQSVIWPIYNLETVTGLSIHEVDDKIDTGRILYKEVYPIPFRASLKKSVEAGARVTSTKVPPALRYVCENFEMLRARATPQSGGASYTTPSLSAFLRMIRNNRKLYRRVQETIVQ